MGENCRLVYRRGEVHRALVPTGRGAVGQRLSRAAPGGRDGGADEPVRRGGGGAFVPASPGEVSGGVAVGRGLAWCPWPRAWWRSRRRSARTWRWCGASGRRGHGRAPAGSGSRLLGCAAAFAKHPDSVAPRGRREVDGLGAFSRGGGGGWSGVAPRKCGSPSPRGAPRGPRGGCARRSRRDRREEPPNGRCCTPEGVGRLLGPRDPAVWAEFGGVAAVGGRDHETGTGRTSGASGT